MNEFTATNHAMMVGWIARAVVKTVGELEGERIVRKAVKKYASQRGTRMALRAKSNGHKLTMDTYMAYSEWSAHKGEVKQKILEKNPDVRIQITECPWHTAWMCKLLYRKAVRPGKSAVMS